MNALHRITLSFLVLAIAGCSAKPARIQVIYGKDAAVQHGLRTEVWTDDGSGAFIEIQNTTTNLISINQAFLAFEITVTSNTKAVEPTGVIKLKLDLHPRPNDFVIIAPDQTKKIYLPLRLEGDQLRAMGSIYTIKKGEGYRIEAKLNPYFGSFNKETDELTLSKYKIPNYLQESLNLTVNEDLTISKK